MTENFFYPYIMSRVIVGDSLTRLVKALIQHDPYYHKFPLQPDMTHYHRYFLKEALQNSGALLF